MTSLRADALAPQVLRDGLLAILSQDEMAPANQALLGEAHPVPQIKDPDPKQQVSQTHSLAEIQTRLQALLTDQSVRHRPVGLRREDRLFSRCDPIADRCPPWTTKQSRSQVNSTKLALGRLPQAMYRL
ncbi:MAG: hypothetical protein P1V97_24545 [Planctomycetota bacterium]|nr:hypothetical protein [Planctomycetota bacterium]